ncbi:MAG: hypothetical protein AB7E42_07020 [Anaerotignaceae bacterium]
MKLVEFEMMKREFTKADDDGKIRMYVETEGLTKEQYGQLLRLFPLNKINQLEEALK